MRKASDRVQPGDHLTQTSDCIRRKGTDVAVKPVKADDGALNHRP